MNSLTNSLVKRMMAATADGSLTPEIRKRKGVDVVWTLITIGVMAVLTLLVFAIVPSLQSAGQQMKSALDGAPWGRIMSPRSMGC
jgi:hypothetical protein